MSAGVRRSAQSATRLQRSVCCTIADNGGQSAAVTTFGTRRSRPVVAVAPLLMTGDIAPNVCQSTAGIHVRRAAGIYR